MRGNVPALSMFTGVSLQSMISSSVVRRGWSSFVMNLVTKLRSK
jgi:hypothetical protein